MRVLVAIANYGDGNAAYLQRLLAQYRSSRFAVTLVVLSDRPKDLGPDVEVRVGLPIGHGWSLPFAHRSLFAERQRDYDLFIYSEDDTLIEDAHIDAFLDANAVLKADEIPGFMRYEVNESGESIYECMHSAFRFLPHTVCLRGDRTFAAFSNEHSACSMMTRDQLQRAVASGGFLVAPHEGRYDLLCAGGNDIYTQCGLTRLICVSELERYSLHHLSNKYVKMLGVPGREVKIQVQMLERLAKEGGWCGPLVEPETAIPAGAWWKKLHDGPEPAVLDLVPATARRILVVGSGSGAAELPLLERAERVVVLPIDPVLGHCAQWRGFDALMAGEEQAAAALEGASFDCVLFPWVLHLVDDPVRWMRRFAARLVPGGSVVISVPKTGDLSYRITKIGPRPGSEHLRKDRELLSSLRRWREVQGWLRAARLARVAAATFEPDVRWGETSLLKRIGRNLFATGLAVRAVSPGKPAA